MTTRSLSKAVVAVVAVAGIVVGQAGWSASAAMSGADSAATSTGPSTVTAPYALPAAPGVCITSLLTVNDAGSAATATS